MYSTPMNDDMIENINYIDLTCQIVKKPSERSSTANIIVIHNDIK